MARRRRVSWYRCQARCSNWFSSSSLLAKRSFPSRMTSNERTGSAPFNVTRSKEEENLNVNNYFIPASATSIAPASEVVHRDFSFVKFSGMLVSTDFVIRINFPVSDAYIVKPTTLDVNSLIIQNNSFEILRKTRESNNNELSRVPDSIVVRERFSYLTLTTCGLTRVQHVLF